MKNNTHPTAGLASDRTAEPAAIKLNASAVAGGASLSTEQLLRVGTIYTELQMASLIGGLEQPVATAVMAGIVGTLHQILPPAQFRDVLIQWEIDAIRLSELLHLAQVSERAPQGQIIEA